MGGKKKEKVFKLVFSTDGTFKHVEGPNGKKVKRLTFEEMRDPCYYDKDTDEKVSFQDLASTGRRESIKMIDLPGHSICGIVCGGIPFCWC